jgi:uncharacterized protein (TIGR03083 family)
MTADAVDRRVTFATQLEVLSASIDRLATLVHSLTPQQLRQQAYPSEWTVADVLSHLGSGAEITRGRLDGDVDMQSVWDAWNAKDPDAQAADALEADAALRLRLAALTPEEREQLRFAMGPMELDLPTFLGMRISEHALHTWDVAVTFDDTATVPPDAAGLIVDNLAMMAPFAGKPTGADRRFAVHTVGPTRQFEIVLRPDGVTLTPGVPGVPGDPGHPGHPKGAPDLELSADGLIRLVYGRLDPDHTPTVRGSEADLDELRRAFPGV